jgi:hypothetical protein
LKPTHFLADRVWTSTSATLIAKALEEWAILVFID